MRIEKTLSGNCPAGLLAEYDLMSRLPERRQDILDQALASRAEKRLMQQETLRAFTWHPIHTTKVMLITGLVTFVLVWLVSGISALGHWYAQAKSYTVAVPMPLVQPLKIDIGSYIPTSTYLALSQQLPSFGWRESLYFAFAAMLVVLLEKLLLTVFQWNKVQRMRRAIQETDDELALLEKWRAGD